MWTINDILHRDNFNDLNKNELLEVILTLRNDLKYYKYRKDTGHDQLATIITTLKGQIAAEKAETARLKQVNSNYRDRIMGQLTIWERIKGRIDLKN